MSDLCVACQLRKRASTCDHQRCKPCCVKEFAYCKLPSHRRGAREQATPPVGKPATPSTETAPSVPAQAKVSEQQPQQQVTFPSNWDLSELRDTHKRDAIYTQIWRQYTMKQIDEDDTEERDEAMARWQANLALVEELFDGRGAADLLRQRAADEARVGGGAARPPDTDVDAAAAAAGTSGKDRGIDERLARLRALRRIADTVGEAGSSESLAAAVLEAGGLLGDRRPRGLLQLTRASPEAEGAGIGSTLGPSGFLPSWKRRCRRVPLSSGEEAPPHRGAIQL